MQIQKVCSLLSVLIYIFRISNETSAKTEEYNNVRKLYRSDNIVHG